MSDLWQSRPNHTNAMCTVSTEFNSWCLKILRVESGTIKLEVKLHHYCIFLHICLCFSESAKQLLQPLTLTRQPGKLPSVCHWEQRLSPGEVTTGTLGPLLPCTHPACDTHPLSEAVAVQDILELISGTSFWKYCYDDSHKWWNAE